MKDIHYSLKPNRNSKQQALEIIKLLQESIPIEKAQMRLLLTIPPKKAKTVLETLQKFIVSIEKEEWEEDLMVVRKNRFFKSQISNFFKSRADLFSRSRPLSKFGGEFDEGNYRKRPFGGFEFENTNFRRF
eukprot:Sdes_comp20876_c0_seq2m17846